MHVGHYISGAGHIGLIGWLFIGGIFNVEPLPFEATDVSVISGQEFEAMMAAQRSDQAAEAVQPDLPEPESEVPNPPPEEETPEPPPEPVDVPEPEEPPQIEEPTPPEPEPVEPVEDLRDPVGAVNVPVPDVADRPVPRPADRVAPEPVAQPEPDAQVDDVEQPAVREDDAGEQPEEPQEATAPEEATTEIVTEAASAPKASSRPPGKRPAAPARPEPETAETDVDTDAIADALRQAQTEEQPASETPAASEPSGSSGPPMSRGEKESLRVAVSACWNIGALSSEATRTTVVVMVAMGRDGRPNVGSIKMVGSSGGSDAAANQAFGAARRAIIRCGADGYKLPLEKYDQWKNIEMTFNPERMRIK